VAPFFGGDPLARTIFMSGLVLGLICNLWFWWIDSDEKRHSGTAVLAYFALAPIYNSTAAYYLGVFGPIVVVFVLNIFSACLGYGKRVARVAMYASMAPMAVLGPPMAFGWIEDVGLISFGYAMGTTGKLVVVFAFILFLYLVYLQARATRRVVVGSLIDRDDAVRRAAHREAMLLEARQDLERALHAGGMGRFTDQTLGGYKLGAVIGRGGMGEVYEATHADTGEEAAVKMLLPEVLARPEYVRRFMREVHIAASLDSPHVVKVLAMGDESAPLPYLAMELLRGEDLAHRLRRVSHLDAQEVADLVRQAGRAVQAAADAGIVHRDLKPQNLFVTDDPEPVWKVLDFGVSKLVAGVTITQNETVGTPQYMAPEQARGGEVDVRTDLYALGAIAYRALTGLPPFSGHDPSEVMMAVMREMPVRPTLIADVARQIDLVLAIALAKEPSDRFQDGDALADAIEAASAGRLSAELCDRAAALLDAMPWSDVR
jgi:serine/threonine-protein kinase